jgi:hypothetical protein
VPFVVILTTNDLVTGSSEDEFIAEKEIRIRTRLAGVP